MPFSNTYNAQFTAGTESEGWTLHTYASLSSTNFQARQLPPWHAVRARIQTGGYGRTGRSWVSDEGGLWLSAVLPTGGSRELWRLLPLGAGWAVAEALTFVGAENLRLRWPNDILVGHRKLAGLLVERFNEQSVVIGLGLNIFNRPEETDPALTGATIALSDLCPGIYSVHDVAALALRAFRHLHETMEREGFAQIAADINRRWTAPSLIELKLHDRRSPLVVHFDGTDDEGRLRVRGLDGTHQSFSAQEIDHLREIEIFERAPEP
jgi:BirA family biotin operon repressor/biotin-[acetyl-CoA-carboxylase] ligase